MPRDGRGREARGLTAYRALVAAFAVAFVGIGVAVFAVVFVGLGLALLVVTALRGGGAVGFVLGALFVALGAGRLHLLRRR